MTNIVVTTPHYPPITVLEAMDPSASPSSLSESSTTSSSQSSLPSSPSKNPLICTRPRTMKRVRIPVSRLREISRPPGRTTSKGQEEPEREKKKRNEKDTDLFVDTNPLVPLKYSLGPVALPKAKRSEGEPHGVSDSLHTSEEGESNEGLVILKGSGRQEGKRREMASMSTLKRESNGEDDKLEQSSDTNTIDSNPAASLPLPRATMTVITKHHHHDDLPIRGNEEKDGKKNDDRRDGEEDGIIKGSIARIPYLHTEGKTKAIDDESLSEVMQRGEELLWEIRSAHSRVPFPSMESQTDCFSIEKSEIMQRVTKVLYTSSANAKNKDDPIKRKPVASRQKTSKLPSESDKACPWKGEFYHRSASSLEKYIHLTTQWPTTEPVEPEPYHATRGNLITHLNVVTSVWGDERQREKGRGGFNGACTRRKEQGGGVRGSTGLLDVCHTGGVTLVESELDMPLIMEETSKQRGEREEEGEKEIVKAESIPTISLDCEAQSSDNDTQNNKLLDQPTLAIQVLPSVTIDPVTPTTTTNKCVETESACNGILKTTTPHPVIVLEGRPSPPHPPLPPPPPLRNNDNDDVVIEERETGHHFFSNGVSAYEVQQRAQSHLKGQAKQWAQHELLVQLLSSLGSPSSSSVSSLESQPHSVATETGDVAGLVREILLKEALGFYQMKEETESHQDEDVYDYSNSSFESESVTPIATPSPTPPSTPPIPKEAVPIEHTPQVTPTGSLTALTCQKEEEELSTPQGSPFLSSTEANFSLSHQTTASGTYDVLGNASVTTPTATPTSLSLHNESEKGEEENEAEPFDREETSKEKPGASVTDSSSFSSSSSQSKMHDSDSMSDSSCSTDHEISLGEHLKLLPGAVPIATRNDVSLSEGEVPLSPGDTRWKTFTDTRTKQTLRGNNIYGDFDQLTDSITTSQEIKKVSTPLNRRWINKKAFPTVTTHPPIDPSPLHAVTPNLVHNIRPEEESKVRKGSSPVSTESDDDTLAHVPSLSDSTHSLTQDKKPRNRLNSAHSSLSPGEVTRPQVKESVAESSQISEGEVPLRVLPGNRKVSMATELRDGIDVIDLSHKRGVDHTHSDENIEVVRVTPLKNNSAMPTSGLPHPQSKWVSQDVLSSASSLEPLPVDANGPKAGLVPVLNVSARGPVVIMDIDNEDNISSIDSLTLT